MPSQKPPRPRSEPGSLADAQKELWHALTTASRLLDAHDRDVRLRACHAVGQLTGSYAKLAQAVELEERVKQLEQRLEAHYEQAERDRRQGLLS